MVRTTGIGIHLKARIRLLLSGAPRTSGALDVSAVDQFLILAPGDERAPEPLFRTIHSCPAGPFRESLEKRLFRDYPASDEAKSLKELRLCAKGLGKPLELEFVDAISGRKVSM